MGPNVPDGAAAGRLSRGRKVIGRRDALRLGAGALAGGALAAACGGEDADSDGGDDAGGLPELLVPRPPEGQAANGLLHIGLLEGDPLPLGLLYSRLAVVDPRDASVQGDLAESVEQPDALTLAFHLRPDTRFHPDAAGGSETLTASEVVRDFRERAEAGEFLFTRVVEKVEAPDDATVVLRLSAPFSLIFEFLGDPAAAGIRSESTYEGSELRRGSGPFAPSRLAEPSEQLLPHGGYHHRGLPMLDGIDIARMVSQTELDQAFGGGVIDLARYGTAESQAASGERADVHGLVRASRHMIGLGLSLVGTKGGGNVRFNPAFQDERVRRAIAGSIDQLALLEQIVGALSGPVGPGFAADALPEEELVESPLYIRDVTAATQLLQAAGEEGLAIRLDAPSVSPLRQVAQLIEEQLRETGFDVMVNLLPHEEWERAFKAGDFEATLFKLAPLKTPDIGLRLHTSTGLDEGYSLWGFSDPEYDSAVADALTALSPAARADRSRDAQRLLLEHVPAMFPLAAPFEFASIARRIEGFEFDAFDFNDQWLPVTWRVRAL